MIYLKFCILFCEIDATDYNRQVAGVVNIQGRLIGQIKPKTADIVPYETTFKG